MRCGGEVGDRLSASGRRTHLTHCSTSLRRSKSGASIVTLISSLRLLGRAEVNFHGHVDVNLTGGHGFQPGVSLSLTIKCLARQQVVACPLLPALTTKFARGLKVHFLDAQDFRSGWKLRTVISRQLETTYTVLYEAGADW